MRAALPLSLFLPILCGCLFPLGSGEPRCPNEGLLAEGALEIEGETWDAPAVAHSRLVTDYAGRCLTGLSLTLDLGQGCEISIEADGDATSLQVFDANIWGAEDCGLEGFGWQLYEGGASTVEVNTGRYFSMGGNDTVCFDGSLAVTYDLLFEDDGVIVPIQGSVELTGVDKAWFESRQCD